MDKQSRIFIAGHNGMVGSAILRALDKLGYSNLLVQERSELDLTSQADVFAWLDMAKPDYIVVAAAKVGGIHANNTFPAEFLYDNLMIEANLIHGAHRVGCKELLFLGSSCIYPKLAPQPMPESVLLEGHLEPTNEPYAIAKIAGIKLCESYNRQYGYDYRSLMPTNLYGEGDNFHAENSHVIPALMRRFHEAKSNGDNEVVVWGTGAPKREFLHVDDLAAACTHIMTLPLSEYQKVTSPMQSHINVGTGVDVTIRELAELMVSTTGFPGQLSFDTTKPDGTPRKLLDVSLLKSTGWAPAISLEAGLRSTYEWFLSNQAQIRT